MNKPALLLVCLLAELPQAAWSLDQQALQLRREYNGVVASMDSLLRLYGRANFAELAKGKGQTPVMQTQDLVLIFWADDEAQVYLNGYLVGQTRLTPTLVEIPRFYLREENILSAQCWDTDRVVYGFMAGLYLRDPGGGLRQVTVTDEDSWSSDGTPTAPSYPPTFSQPDIPAARVIWKEDQSYGSVWLETRFSANRVRRAAYSQRHPPSQLAVVEEPMIFHEIVSHVSHLKSRQKRVGDALAKRRQLSSQPVLYRGFARSDLALTLGHAGRLSEELSLQTAANLTAWARQLPAPDSGLVFRDPRKLKGLAEATAGLRKPAGSAESRDEDRQLNYQPPPERGPASWVLEAKAEYPPLHTAVLPWTLTMFSLCLLLYTGFLARQGWFIYRDEVWNQ